MNALQMILEAAAEERQALAYEAALNVRESIRPLERRRFHALAALVALTPIDRRL